MFLIYWLSKQWRMQWRAHAEGRMHGRASGNITAGETVNTTGRRARVASVHTSKNIGRTTILNSRPLEATTRSSCGTRMTRIGAPFASTLPTLLPRACAPQTKCAARSNIMRNIQLLSRRTATGTFDFDHVPHVRPAPAGRGGVLSRLTLARPRSLRSPRSGTAIIADPSVDRRARDPIVPVDAAF